jgi:hypothetical protein
MPTTTMDNSSTQPRSGQPSYLDFIWKEKANRKYLLWGTGLCALQFVIFKLLYPFPDFFSDSYSYIYAAYAHLDISIWPIGYSKFLALFHALTVSDTALVACQYFLIQISALYFFFTVTYFFNTSKLMNNVLFVFIFVNPLTLYLANTINSDALFGALSLLWVTELIWIIQRPSLTRMFIQAALLFLCFTIRNNAYYYPLIAALAILLSRQVVWYKVVGIVLPLFFIFPFILLTRDAAYKATGTRQFSLFTGWQLANNALYIYNHTSVDSTWFGTPQSRELNRISGHFFRHIDKDKFQDYLGSFVGNFFIKEPDAPLKQYFEHHYKFATEEGSIAAWARASAVFESFGEPIIVHSPMAYVRYFMLPNAGNYFWPPLSHLEVYNYGQDRIEPIAAFWFRYKKPEVHVFSHEFQGYLLMIYPAIFLLMNLYFLFILFQFGMKHGFSINDRYKFKETFLMISGLFVLNAAFSIIATLNILRYQFVPMIVIFTACLIATEMKEALMRGAAANKKQSEMQNALASWM